MHRESEARSILKAVSWRFWGTIVTSTIVYAFTGRVGIAVTVGGLEALAKIGVFFVHERVWDKVKFGKQSLQPAVLWFTGLSGSGKTTVAERVCTGLNARGFKAEFLDGDQIRRIFPKTGFTKEERDAHVGRVGYLASRLEANGIFVIASLISPYRDSRELIRRLCKNFVEIYVSTPIEVCEKRDEKGLYARARRGEIKNFTGVDDPYEPPINPEIDIDMAEQSVEEATNIVLQYVQKTYIDQTLFKKLRVGWTARRPGLSETK